MSFEIISAPDVEASNILMAQDFIAALTGSPNTPMTFQTFDDRKPTRPTLAQTLHGPIDEFWPELSRLNSAGAGVFVTINETNGSGRKAKDVVRVRSVFIDIDGGQDQVRRVRLQLAELDVAPDIIVETARGQHCYFLVDDLPLDGFGAYQLALATKFGTDPAIKDLSRVMRVPGTLHLKGSPVLVRLVGGAGHAVS